MTDPPGSWPFVLAPREDCLTTAACLAAVAVLVETAGAAEWNRDASSPLAYRELEEMCMLGSAARETGLAAFPTASRQILVVAEFVTSSPNSDPTETASLDSETPLV